MDVLSILIIFLCMQINAGNWRVFCTAVQLYFLVVVALLCGVHFIAM
jgi:hypothetical protein